MASTNLSSTLKKYFGYSVFRPFQREIIENILEGRDALVVMATGSGKSLCYQIPPLLTGKTAVVISPLLSLMQDQVMSLKHRGIEAEYLGSSQTDSSVYSKAESGHFAVLYMTPERACSLSHSFWSKLLNVGVCMFAVDEAHCISEWGHDFRKEYKQLHNLRNMLLHVPFVALTATATQKVRTDIISSLKLKDPYITFGSFDRTNLFYGVKSFGRSLPLVHELVGEISKYLACSGSTIIYCTTIKDTKQIFTSLQNAGIKAGLYHGQMSNRDREESHRSFIRDELHVMVATIAFGMGIDKPNIRCVIHYGCPKSLESYYQESGRCGRDGLASICWLYYSRNDFVKAEFYCGEAQTAVQRKSIMDSFMAAQRYCSATTCRRKFLLEYFGENVTSNNCGNCDNCTSTKRERDMSKEVYLLMSCIASCGGRWGLNMPIDILRGSRSKKIVDVQFDKLPLHGLGRDYSPDWWKALSQQLISNGYLIETIKDVYRTVSVSGKGLEFLSRATGDHQPPLVLAVTDEMVDEEEHRETSKIEGDFQDIASLKREGFSEAEEKLYHMLFDMRLNLARIAGVAPYAICGDQTIKKIALTRPSTIARLANIDGVNQHLVISYGDHILQMVRNLSQELNISLDRAASIQTATARVYSAPKSNRKLTSAKFDAWKMWHEDGLTFPKIANFPGRPAPIKEQTVMEYILEAAQEGYQINWERFCEEIRMTREIFSEIQAAIAKVGSRERLKPIKEEVPEHVTYGHIKTFFTIQDLGLSTDLKLDSEPLETFELQTETLKSSLSPNLTNSSKTNPESDVVESFSSDERKVTPLIPVELQTETLKSSLSPNLTDSSKTNPESDVVVSFSSDERKVTPLIPVSVLGSERVVGTKHPHISEDNISPWKCSKIESTEDLLALQATESTVLELLRDHDGVALTDILDQFKGSKEESIIELLRCLENEYMIFRQKGLYKIL